MSERPDDDDLQRRGELEQAYREAALGAAADDERKARRKALLAALPSAARELGGAVESVGAATPDIADEAMSVRGSVNEPPATPTTSDENTSGTTIISSKRRNSWPTGCVMLSTIQTTFG